MLPSESTGTTIPELVPELPRYLAVADGVTEGAMVVSKRTPSGYMAHDDFIPILTSLMNCLCLKFANSDITTKQY